MNVTFLSVVLGSYVFGAVTSQSLLDFAASLIFLSWIYCFIKKEKRTSAKVSWIGIEWAFAGYFICVLLGFYLNQPPIEEVLVSLGKFVWILNLYFLIFAFQNTNLDLKKIIQFFSIGFLVPNLYALISFFLGFDLLTQKESDRVIGLLTSATYHAHANAVLFVFFASCFILWFRFLNRRWRLFSMFAIFIFGLSIFLTFTRGIWFSIFLSSILMGFLLDKRKTIFLTSIGILLVVLAYLSWPQFHNRVVKTFDPSESSERINLFKVNVQIWKEYPFLGIGYRENMRRNREYWDRPEWNMPKDYITSHAHNQYLNVLATTGIFGFVFFMSFFCFFIYKNWKLLLQTSPQSQLVRYVILFSCLWAQLEFFIGCWTDVSFEYAKIRALLILVWALVIAIDQKPEIICEDTHA